MTIQILGGSTSQTVRLFIQDTSKTDGSGLTGLAHNTSGLTAYYSKGATGTATAITLATQTAGGAWTSGGFVAVDGTNMPGVYRLDVPNAALDSEVETIVMLRGAANMAPVLLRVMGGKSQANAVTVADKTGYTLSTAGVSGVTDGVWNALLSSYTTNGSFGARLIRSTNSNNQVSLTGGPTPHIAASIHNAEPDSIPAGALTDAAIAEIQAGLALQSTLLSAKSVTDKLNTGLVADGAVFQFTANMLELAPQASGGGSATIENQELILDELDTLRSSFAAAVGRLAVASQITGFPAALVRNSDYSTVTESEIRLSLNDLDGNPITEIGGVQCSEIEWLFGLGSERAPAIIEGAATWDNANSQLVIQIDADDTAATPLGTLSWQIGCTIDTTTRFLGGGTTRLIERQF